MSHDYLTPGRFIDSDDADVAAFARAVTVGAPDDMERALRLYCGPAVLALRSPAVKSSISRRRQTKP